MDFWEAFKNSTIIQGTITLVVVAGVTYLAVTQQPIPEVLSGWGALVVGFYFGSKVQASVMQGPKK